MDDAYLFDEYARLVDAGHRLDRSRFPKEAAAEYDRYLGRARSMIASALQVLPGLPSIYPDFVANPAFNAYAAKYKGAYFIAFFDGLPIIVATIINRMLADGSNFREVGDSKEEVSDLPLLTGLAPNAAKIYESNRQAVVPRNAFRQIYAAHLCHFVFDFLAAHELAHIVNGHAGYTAFEFTIPCMMELGSIPATPEASIESQAMEMDADFTAALPVVTTLKRVVSDRNALPQPMAARYQDPGKAIFDMGAAVCIIFRLFGDSPITGVDTSKSSHPPYRLRQRLILNAMGNYVEKFWDTHLYAIAEQEFSRAIAAVENAFELMTGGPQQVEGLNDAWNVSGLAYATRIADYWNNILRHKMNDHAFAKLSTYSFDQQNLDEKGAGRAI